jgi:hypothetical protein
LSGSLTVSLQRLRFRQVTSEASKIIADDYVYNTFAQFG